MSMDNFPGNSRRAASTPSSETAKPEERTVDPVITGKVIRRKTPLHKRFARMFFSGTGEGLLEGIIRDVFVPALQSTVTDMITQGINRAIYGEARPTGYRSPTRPGQSGPVISYNRMARPTSATSSYQSPSTAARRPADRRDAYDIGDVILEDRLDAQVVLENLMSEIEDYGSVTVATLFNLMKQSSVHTDHNWGWTNLGNADIRRVNEGWMILLPPPEHLGR